jgi:hypothetical protein
MASHFPAMLVLLQTYYFLIFGYCIIFVHVTQNSLCRERKETLKKVAWQFLWSCGLNIYIFPHAGRGVGGRLNSNTENYFCSDFSFKKRLKLGMSCTLDGNVCEQEISERRATESV